MSLTNTLQSLKRRIYVSGECWIWMGSKSGRGYGRVSVKGRIRPAHVAFYEMSVGPVPAGLELDHKCRNTSCVNPDHMEPVTHRENILRGTSPAAQHAKKTHCPRGHEYTPENTWLFDGGRRRCRECTKESNKLRMRNYREQGRYKE